MYIRRCIDYIFLYFLENYQKAVHHSSYCGFIRPIKTSIGYLSSLNHLKIFHFHEYLLNVDSMGGFLLKLYVVVQSRDILLLAPMERFLKYVLYRPVSQYLLENGVGPQSYVQKTPAVESSNKVKCNLNNPR